MMKVATTREAERLGPQDWFSRRSGPGPREIGGRRKSSDIDAKDGAELRSFWRYYSLFPSARRRFMLAHDCRSRVSLSVIFSGLPHAYLPPNTFFMRRPDIAFYAARDDGRVYLPPQFDDAAELAGHEPPVIGGRCAAIFKGEANHTASGLRVGYGGEASCRRHLHGHSDQGFSRCEMLIAGRRE